MKKSFWVKKDPNSTAGWVEMNGKQFYEFINSTDGKGRYFIDYGDFMIEVSYEQHRLWKQEMNRRRYLQGFEDDTLVLSLENLAKEEWHYHNCVFVDLTVNIEEKVIADIDRELLRAALRSLPADEYRLITELYLTDKPKSEQEIAVTMGISKQAVNKRKKKILEKLKMSVVKLKKSQQ